MLLATVILTIIVSLFIFSGKKSSKPSVATSSTQKDVYDVASADTNNETLRTLIAGQQRLERENKDLREKNSDLTKKQTDVFQKKFDEEKVQLESQFSNEKNKLMEQIKKVSNSDQRSHDKESSSDAYELNASDNNIGDVGDMSQINISLDGKSKPILKKFAPGDNGKPALPSPYDNAQEKDKTEKFYTIPSNSTLAKTILMTNIIGEVPVMGKLIEPAMPFKAIIAKKDLLASNGMKLPNDLGGIVVSGYSVGNMSLSCARMYVTQLLFTFEDGSFTV